MSRYKFPSNWLWPWDESSDSEWRAYVQRSARRGLAVIAGVEFGMTAVTLSLDYWFSTELALASDWRWNMGFVAIGAGALAARSVPALAPYWRAACFTIGLLTIALLATLDVLFWQGIPGLMTSINVLTVLLVTVAAVPATFGQIFLFGLVATGIRFGAVFFNLPDEVAGGAPAQLLMPTLLLVGLCAVLGGLNYSRARDSVGAGQKVLQSELARVQTEYSAALSQLAAGLSHEMNTPLGSLRSATSSLLQLVDRQTQPKNERISGIQQELSHVIEESTGRLSELVGRMQRFSNLDRAAVHDVDLRVLIDDVAGLCGCGLRIRNEVNGVPPVMTDATAVSAALAQVLRASAERDEFVTATARHSGPAIELAIDTGRLVSLEPEWEVRDGRVGAGNWELFHLRQMLQARGVDVKVEKSTILLRFPVAEEGLGATATA